MKTTGTKLAAAALALAAIIFSAAASAFAADNFTLPSLPYATDAFDTSIDNTTMTFHWTRCAQRVVLAGCRRQLPPVLA